MMKNNNGYITNKAAQEAGITSFFITKFVRENKLEKIDRGFYAHSSWPIDEYLVFQKRYPRYIYSFYSALFLHGLTDKLVSEKEVTAPNGYHPYRQKPVGTAIHIERDIEIFEMGIIEVKTMYGNRVRAYDIEKTICDLVKNRDKIDSETFVKAMRNYAARKEKNGVVLMKYAKALGIEKEVFEIMEIIDNP
jgi:predicted transcriptional regulator of viral defense system